jgi:hypothetical protein
VNNIATPAVAVMAVAALMAGEASAAHNYRHIDEVAFRLMKRAEVVRSEVLIHYRRTPQYRHLVSDVREMEQLARHIHVVAHRGGTLSHLRHDVRKLDRLFHHVEGLVDAMARSRTVDFRTIHHIREALADLHVMIRHLKRDLL